MGHVPRIIYAVFICPMRQQHWTDYKISLCVCRSVSQWISGPPPYLVNGWSWKLQI